MSLIAEDVAIELVRALRGPVQTLAAHDRDLEAQVRTAATSAALNVGEARRREGKDRINRFRIALGSAGEVRTALRVAEAWGYLASEAAAAVEPTLDRLLALLWVLSHPR